MSFLQAQCLAEVAQARDRMLNLMLHLPPAHCWRLKAPSMKGLSKSDGQDFAKVARCYDRPLGPSTC